MKLSDVPTAFSKASQAQSMLKRIEQYRLGISNADTPGVKIVIRCGYGELCELRAFPGIDSDDRFKLKELLADFCRARIAELTAEIEGIEIP